MVEKNYTILGAIAGDIVGSAYEWNNVKTTDFELFTPESDFTDDTVLTIAVADCILNKKDFAKTLWEYGRMYPGRGYGLGFSKWLLSDKREPYNSYGNGSAMRVSPVGFAYDNLDDVLEVAKKSAEVTHNHPEGIKGAQSVAAAIFLSRSGASKPEIRSYITEKFKYNLDLTIDQIRPHYTFDETCQGSVPQAIVAFLESTDYENAVRLAVSLGGDSDTISCIAGGIAAGYYGVIPKVILDYVGKIIPKQFKTTIKNFNLLF